MSEEPRRLNLRPERKGAPCGLCGGVSVVVRDLTFRPCLCPLGELPGVCHWDGVPVHPLDFVPTAKALMVETKGRRDVAETA